MSSRDSKKSHVIRNYIERRLTRREAAESLDLSERQITRIAKEMKEEGEAALIHKNTGRKPKHALTEGVKGEIIRLYRQEVYQGCNISHFLEILEEHHKIKISYKALYNLFTKNAIQSPQKHSKKKTHRRRKRKKHAGELLQIDATPYEWFGDGINYALHAAIDDATGQITGAYMTPNECLQGYFEIMRQTCLNHGVALSAYSDKHTIFRSPKTEKMQEQGEEANLTQFGRALAELGTNIIYAHSPQAKGRIERLWATLQSRLPVEFRLHGISTIEQANEFLKEYLPLFNKRFCVQAEAESIFVPYTHPEDIDNILCVKEVRKMDNAGSFSYRGKCFKVVDEGYPLIPARASVLLLISTRYSLQVQYNNRIFKAVSYIKPDKVKPKKTKSHVLHKQIEPLLKHGSENWKKVWHYENYNDSLELLYSVFFKAYA